MFQANHFPVACGFECFSCCPSACVSFSLVIQVAFILKIIFYFWRSICLFLFCWMAAFNYVPLPYAAAVCSQIMNPLRSPFLPSPAHTRGTSCCFAVMTVWRGVCGSAEDPCLCPSQLMGSFPAFCSDPPACAPVQHSLGREASSLWLTVWSWAMQGRGLLLIFLL